VVVEVVHAKVPGTLATPPFSLDSLKAWPKLIPTAVGAVWIVGIPLAIVNVCTTFWADP
jgi:hypothetical protein